MNVEGARPWPEAQATAYRAAGYWTGQTLGKALQEQASRYATRCALVAQTAEGTRRLSYAELFQQSARLAFGLRSLGLRRGDVVILQIPNRIELVEALLALAWLGVPPVLALPSHRQFELRSFAETTGAKAIITVCGDAPFDYAGLAERVASDGLQPMQVLCVDATPPAGCASKVVPRPEGDLRSLEVSMPMASDLLLFQLSGGTTGTPKLIPRTHDDYLYSVRAAVAACGWNQEIRYLAALPAQHNFPLSSPGVLGVLLCGGRAVLARTPSPAECFPWIEREQVRWVALVPSLLQVWLEAAKQRGAPRPLEYVQVGGAPLAVALAHRVPEALQCRLQQVFGMAEGLVCYTRPNTPREIAEACQGWPASPADEIRIVDLHGQPVPPGTEGDLLTRGPYTIRGYFRDQDEHHLRFTADGFYRTGDRVVQTPEGALRVVGRSKEQINRGGDKIAPAEVEGHLLAHPQVIEAALIPIADPLLGERSCAFIAHEGQELTAADLRTFLRSRGVAAYKIPDQFQFLSELPKTGVRKIDKQHLKGTLHEHS